MRKSIGGKKKPCKNCEGKGTLKKGDKIVKCQRCGGPESSRHNSSTPSLAQDADALLIPIGLFLARQARRSTKQLATMH
jgi:hypothetical protein